MSERSASHLRLVSSNPAALPAPSFEAAMEARAAHVRQTFPPGADRAWLLSLCTGTADDIAAATEQYARRLRSPLRVV